MMNVMRVQISEPILDRNQINGHAVTIRSGEGEGLENSIKNPYSPVNATNLVKFMFMLHRRKGLTPHRDFTTYLRQAKKLIDVVGPDEAESLMLKAAKLSKYAWGFAFIERLRSE